MFCWHCIEIYPYSKYRQSVNTNAGHTQFAVYRAIEASWNVMAHAQEPDLVFVAKRTNPFKSAGWRKFSRLRAAEVCASAVVMLDTPCSEVVWRVLAAHCIRQFSPRSVRHRVPSHSNWTLNLEPSGLYLECYTASIENVCPYNNKQPDALFTVNLLQYLTCKRGTA